MSRLALFADPGAQGLQRRICALDNCTAYLDPGLTYDDKPHAPQRLYCSRGHRAAARRARTRAWRAWRRTNAGLADAHHLEQAGQLSVDPRPLPALPPTPGQEASP